MFGNFLNRKDLSITFKYVGAITLPPFFSFSAVHYPTLRACLRMPLTYTQEKEKRYTFSMSNTRGIVSNIRQRQYLRVLKKYLQIQKTTLFEMISNLEEVHPCKDNVSTSLTSVTFYVFGVSEREN